MCRHTVLSIDLSDELGEFRDHASLAVRLELVLSHLHLLGQLVVFRVVLLPLRNQLFDLEFVLVEGLVEARANLLDLVRMGLALLF